jgi:hypothetical protein
LSAVLAGCNGESGTTDYSDDNTYKDPLKNPAPAGCTVYYQTGNGKGSPPKSKLITEQEIKGENNKITLPGEKGLEAPQAAETVVFVGWNDGLLTYPVDYQYTVTKNVTFNARWAFTTLAEITAYLTGATENPVVIAVADAETPDEFLTWEALLSAIGGTKKAVELDLSGSTLALKETTQFYYKTGMGSNYGTGEKYIRKLVLPGAAMSIASIFKQGPFLSLAAVSGLNVSAIPNEAFYGLKTLTAVVFPAAGSIGNAAFNDCAKLTSVSLPAAGTIDDYAFNSCTKLTEVSLPVAETIGSNAFYKCASLTEVSLPAATEINVNAFQYCTVLTSVSLPKTETIKTYAFLHCTGLTSVILPEAKTIEAYAFQYCTGLAEVSLPEAGSIGVGGFMYCYDLTSVSLPKATLVDSAAFIDCFNLTSVNLLKAKTVNSSAFQSCTDLSNITIGKDCDINAASIRGNFQTYYNDNTGHDTKAAGVYTYNTGKSSWSYEPE